MPELFNIILYSTAQLKYTVKNDIFDAITVLVIRSDLQDIHVILTVIIIVLKIFVYKLT